MVLVCLRWGSLSPSASTSLQTGAVVPPSQHRHVIYKDIAFKIFLPPNQIQKVLLFHTQIYLASSFVFTGSGNPAQEDRVNDDDEALMSFL